MIALTSPHPLESNEMATLMSVSVSTGKTNHPVGIFRRGALVIKKKRSREERGLLSVESCSDFKGSSSLTPLCPIVHCPSTDGHVWLVCHAWDSSWNLNTREGGSHMMLQNWLKMSQQRAQLSGKRSHFNLKSAMLWPEQGNTSWLWLRSSWKAPFVCEGLTVIRIHYHPVTPTGDSSRARTVKTTLKPPNTWKLLHIYVMLTVTSALKHHFCRPCWYHGLHYGCPSWNGLQITEHSNWKQKTVTSLTANIRILNSIWWTKSNHCHLLF